MTDKARIRIAAAVTALFLAAISAAGLAARDGRPSVTTTAAQPAVAATSATDRPDGRDGRGDDDRYEGSESHE